MPDQNAEPSPKEGVIKLDKNGELMIWHDGKWRPIDEVHDHPIPPASLREPGI
jgi:hypothetical protein